MLPNKPQAFLLHLLKAIVHPIVSFPLCFSFYIIFSLSDVVLAAEISEEILHYTFGSSPPASWYTESIGSQSRSESPAFVVTGDNLSISFSHTDMFLYLCRLDGSIVFEEHMITPDNNRSINRDISVFKGETLYLALQFGVDKTNTWESIDQISIDGSENEPVNSHLSFFRVARGKLKRFDISALSAALQAINKLFEGNDAQLPTYNPDSLHTLYSSLCSRLRAGDIDNLDMIEVTLDSLLSLQRHILLSNPLIAGTTIVYNTGTSSVAESGSVLKRQSLDYDNSEKEIIIDSEWIVEDFDIDYDGARIILSLRNDNDDCYHLYDFDITTRKLTQLTFSKNASDTGPSYLPDDSVVFASTRALRYDTDSGGMLTSLYRMESDGANIYRIGGSPLNENKASVLPDGRIMYSRYVLSDNKTDTSGLFAVSPDGTAPSLFWNGGIKYTRSILEARGLPSTGELLAVLDDVSSGSLALIDRRKGMDASSSLVKIWPQSPASDEYDSSACFLPDLAFYSDPFPLNEDFFLCCRSTGPGSSSAIWLIDRFGNEIQLLTDPEGCHNPKPLRNRPRPPVIPSRRNFIDESGQMYVLNVYDSPDLKGVAADAVSYLRIIETLPKHTGYMTPPPVIGIYNSAVRRVLGTVPVERDGSAFFTIPPERYVSFQLLDNNGMMIQSMQSSVIVQSGETTGCMGCHDYRTLSPPVAIEKVPYALLHDPTVISIPDDEDRGYSFYDDVQPIFNDACIRCHDYGKSAGEVLNLAMDRTTVFNTAYNDLWRNRMTGYNYDDNSFMDVLVPYSRGSHTSILISTLINGHHGVELSRDEFARIITWIDLGAPYYATYATAYPNNPAGRSPLNSTQLDSLAQLTGFTINQLIGIDGDEIPLISFERPELSYCLHSFSDDQINSHIYDILSIIRAGMNSLSLTPRADMPGFQPCENDKTDIRHVDEAKKRELQNRSAILNESRNYDISEQTVK